MNGYPDGWPTERVEMKRPHGTGSVYQDARGRWVASLEDGWTERGTRRRRTRIAPSEREARQLLVAMMRETAPAAAGHATVKSYGGEWLDRIAATVRPATYSSNRSALQQWIIPTIGRKRLSQLAPADLRAVDAACRKAGKADSTTLRVRAVLTKMLRDAIEDGHKVKPELLTVSRPGVGESSRAAIPPEDVAKLLDAASTRLDASRWIAALRYGIRPAEARGLEWDHITGDAIIIEWQLKALPRAEKFNRNSGFRVPAGFTARQLAGAMHLVRPKSRSGRRILPLLPDLADELARWKTYCRNPHGLVWSDGSHAAEKDDRAAWKALCESAGVPAYDLYSARHTAATSFRGLGMDDQTITALMGHASILSSLPYIHYDADRARALMQAGR